MFGAFTKIIRDFNSDSQERMNGDFAIGSHNWTTASKALVQKRDSIYDSL